MERDFSSELGAFQGQIAAAHRRIGELNAAKAALSSQRQTIVALCQKLGIDPKREVIDAEIAKGEQELQALIKSIDADMRKII